MPKNRYPSLLYPHCFSFLPSFRPESSSLRIVPPFQPCRRNFPPFYFPLRPFFWSSTLPPKEESERSSSSLPQKIYFQQTRQELITSPSETGKVGEEEREERPWFDLSRATTCLWPWRRTSGRQDVLFASEDVVDVYLDAIDLSPRLPAPAK